MINMRDKPWHKHEVKRATSNDLISDMDVAAFSVSSLGKHGGPYCLGLAGMRRFSLT